MDAINAIKAFLRWGEEAFILGHQNGYFSGTGWAATKLREHLAELETENKRISDKRVCRICGKGLITHTSAAIDRCERDATQNEVLQRLVEYLEADKQRKMTFLAEPTTGGQGK